MPTSNARLKAALSQLVKKGYARKALLTDNFLKPELASLVDAVPTGKDWIYETKFDGYRILAVKNKREFALISRNGQVWTNRFPDVAEAFKKVGADSVVLDGEVVTLNKAGKSSFSGLQKSLSESASDAYTYFVFDVIYLNGLDLRPVPLLGRKKILESLLASFGKAKGAKIKLSDFSVDNGEKRFAQACSMQMEGIIAKKVSEPYRGKRGTDWVKIKCNQQDEFVVGGYTDPEGSRQGFGALLLGYYDKQKKFHYAGKVGTGFDYALLNRIKAMLAKIERDKSPFAKPLTSLERRGVHYTDPVVVAQVGYTEWTADGRLRHPTFLGLREDKSASQVQRPEVKQLE